MDFWSRPKIGVFGSAAGDLEKLRPLARLIGEKIARRRGLRDTKVSEKYLKRRRRL